VAAREDELQALVGKGRRLVHGVLRHERHVEQLRLLGEGAVAANAVDRPVAGGRDQPARGACRDAVARPALGGDREGLLRGLLGEVEVAEEADERREDSTPRLAEDLVEDR
jgi:hypothetical protein